MTNKYGDGLIESLAKRINKPELSPNLLRKMRAFYKVYSSIGQLFQIQQMMSAIFLGTDNTTTIKKLRLPINTVPPTEFSPLQSGMYIVRVGTRSHKVLVR